MSEFDFEIIYKKGMNNGNADALSRLEINHVRDEAENEIRTNESVLNVFRYQVMIVRIHSGSLRIQNKNIFNKSRKIIHVKELDRDTDITLFKSQFNPKSLNAIYIRDDDFYKIMEEVLSGTF